TARSSRRAGSPRRRAARGCSKPSTPARSDRHAMAEATFPARYYDGHNAVAHAAMAAITAEGVDIVDAGGELLARWPRDSLMLSGSIAETGAVALTSATAPDARLLLSNAEAARAIALCLP